MLTQLSKPSTLKKLTDYFLTIADVQRVATSYGYWYEEPLINHTVFDEVVLEWWHKDKKLTIYISRNLEIDYFKVDQYGYIETDTVKCLHKLWRWLVYG